MPVVRARRRQAPVAFKFPFFLFSRQFLHVNVISRTTALTHTSLLVRTRSRAARDAAVLIARRVQLEQRFRDRALAHALERCRERSLRLRVQIRRAEGHAGSVLLQVRHPGRALGQAAFVDDSVGLCLDEHSWAAFRADLLFWRSAIELVCAVRTRGDARVALDERLVRSRAGCRAAQRGFSCQLRPLPDDIRRWAAFWTLFFLRDCEALALPAPAVSCADIEARVQRVCVERQT